MATPCPPPSIPTYPSSEPRQPGERSISTGKTEISKNGRSVTIIEGSDGNDRFLNHTYPLVRYEFDGGKVIFDSNNPIPDPDERSISSARTKISVINGRHYITIREPDEENVEFLDRTFRVNRFVNDGKTVIFKP